MPEAPANTRWFTYFPEDYRWSSGVVNCLSVAPWGGADIGEVDQVGRRLRKDIGNDALWFREWIRMANKVRDLGLEAEENNHRLSAAYHHRRCPARLNVDEAVRRLEHPSGNERGVVVARLTGDFSRHEIARHLQIHHLDLRLQERGVHPPSLARPFAVEQGDQYPLGEYHPGG